MKNNKSISIKILKKEAFNFNLNGQYILSENGFPYECEQYVETSDGKILFNGDFYDELLFIPIDKIESNSFTVVNHFHEFNNGNNTTFQGFLRVVYQGGQLVAYSISTFEKYILSLFPITNPNNYDVNFPYINSYAYKYW